MQMKHGLPAVLICINHNTVAIVGKAIFPRDRRRSQQQMSDQVFTLIRRRIQRISVFTRYDQDVRRRLRRYVVKRVAQVVLENSRRGNVACNYLAKQAIGHIGNVFNN